MHPDTPIADTAANDPGRAPAGRIEPVIHSLFFAAFAVMLWKVALPGSVLSRTDWPEAALVLTAAASTLMSWSRSLPLQNVLLAAAILGAIGTTADVLSAAVGLPLGMEIHRDRLELEMPGLISWATPLIWIISVLSSRAVAQLILRSGRPASNYGVWLLGLTTALSVAFDFGVEQLASDAQGWSLGALATRLAGRCVITLVALAVATPALIDKRPRTAILPCQPRIIWVLLWVLYTTDLILNRP